MVSTDYVHGYSGVEGRRLRDQATALARLLHHDTVFRPAGLVLEAGCGTGEQTVIVAPQNPDCRFLSVDLSAESLATAASRTAALGIGNVTFQRGDIHHPAFPDETFDHVFVCFVLEHLYRPDQALHSLKRVLKAGGTITIIEGDHGSAYYHPRSAAAQAAIQCLVDLQQNLGGNSLIGRELCPLLSAAGFAEVHVEPRVVYADAGHPEMVEMFTKRTFTVMVEGVREDAVARGLIGAAEFDRGIRDLYRTAEPDGTFSYTFFKATARKA